jgi:hypothetical protein
MIMAIKRTEQTTEAKIEYTVSWGKHCNMGAAEIQNYTSSRQILICRLRDHFMKHNVAYRPVAK